jgi:predicted ATPase
VLVTSRTPLRLSMEREYPLAPLPVAAAGAPAAAGELGDGGAVELFVDRAQAVRPDFAASPEDTAALVEICSRLDGLPLAIELAAARVRILPPQAILERLRDRLQLLTGGPQDRPPRQRTLRNTIEWSFGLLTEDERILFRRLAVFRGGCTLEAAEQVCDPYAEVQSGVMNALELLVANSMLTRNDRQGSEVRFGMLETVREYASELLAKDVAAEEIRHRHTRYFIEWAERAKAIIKHGMHKELHRRLEEEHDNFRAVLAWTLEQGRLEEALRLTSALWPVCGLPPAE